MIKSLQELAFHKAKEYAEYIGKAKGKNGLSIFKEIYSPNNPSLRDILTMEVVIEDMEETYGVKVTECILTEVFRKPGLQTLATLRFVLISSSIVWSIPRSVSIRRG